MFRAPRSQQCALLCTCHKWGWQKHKHTSEIRSGLVCITGTETWFLTAYKDLNNTQKSTSLTKVTWCFMSSQPVQLYQGEVQQKAACNRKLDTSTSAQSMNWSWGSNPQWQVHACTTAHIKKLDTSSSAQSMNWSWGSNSQWQVHKFTAACIRKLDTSSSAQSMNWSWGSNPWWQIHEFTAACNGKLDTSTHA